MLVVTEAGRNELIQRSDEVRSEMTARRCGAAKMSTDSLAALRIDRSRRRRRVSPWVWAVALAIAAGAVLAPRLLARLQ